MKKKPDVRTRACHIPLKMRKALEEYLEKRENGNFSGFITRLVAAHLHGHGYLRGDEKP